VQGTRTAVVEHLNALARSDDFQDRAAAGRALAVFADVPAAQEPLLALVLDAHDTYVTRTAAEALLRRQDGVGYRLVSRAIARADDHIRAGARELMADLSDISPVLRPGHQ
jgi:hypothetical protein